MESSEFFYRLALYMVSNVGPAGFHHLVSGFGSAHEVFSASPDEMKRLCPRLRDTVIAEILKGPDRKRVLSQLERCRTLDIKIIQFGSAEYPAVLMDLKSPPPFLFVKGRWPLSGTAIGVVGTRSPTDYGILVTRKLTGALSSRGLVIISGFAKGIDAVAHTACLDKNGITAAVLGCGIDILYPSQNRGLYSRMIKEGTFISEYPLGTPPEKKNFPLRNRIISGLSKGVLVTEAGLKSGAIITCRHALKQNRPVFAVPGALYNRNADGPNKLIQNGALLVSHPDDIVNFLKRGHFPDAANTLNPSTFSSRGISASPYFNSEKGDDKSSSIPGKLEKLNPVEKKIYTLIEHKKIPIEKLCELSGSAPYTLIPILLNLEMQGLVERHPGATYCLR